MLFQIDSYAATALYRQLVDQVCYAAASGTLQPLDPLPSIRPLARQLHLNRNTVAKAYTELENLGVIKTIPGKGCFVEAVNTPFTGNVRDNLLNAKIDAALVTAHQLQIDAEAFSARVAERLTVFAQNNPKVTQLPAHKPRSARMIAKTQSPKETSTLAAIPSPAATISATDSDAWTPFTD